MVLPPIILDQIWLFLYKIPIFDPKFIFLIPKIGKSGFFSDFPTPEFLVKSDMGNSKFEIILIAVHVPITSEGSVSKRSS